MQISTTENFSRLLDHGGAQLSLPKLRPRVEAKAYSMFL
jgi:hypothetical protein